jgi:parvulin-like peptidyl-prolyl isomerase
MRIRRLEPVWIAIVLAVWMGGVSCRKKEAAPEAAAHGPQARQEAPPPPGLLARVEGQPITKEMVAAELGQAPRPQGREARELTDVERLALAALVDRELIRKGAAREGIAVSDEEIGNALAALESRPREGAATGPVARDRVQVMLLQEKLAAKHFPSSVTEQEIQEYFKKYAASRSSGDKVKVSRILLKVEPEAGEQAWLEAERRMAEIDSAIRAGLPFDEAARKYSQCPYAKVGGDMGWATKERRPAELFGPALALQPGEMTAPFRVPGKGVHLLKATDRKSEKAGALEEERERIVRILREQHAQESARQLLEKLRAELEVEMYF